MPKRKLHSGMSFEEVQDYCDEKAKPVPEDSVLLDCDFNTEIYILIANLAARMKDNA
ncbi:hypothetical protein LCGC14_0756760 [marine sediment metagenome]|uniref:Uncharacterized protein n=1 Tax=marine sediment metagenome TaxID=412755 RepID=A0A0F9Q2G2_9ZZZZ